MLKKQIKGPNVVLLGLLAGLAYKFPAGINLYYLYLIFISVLLIRQFSIYGIPKFNNSFITLTIISLAYLIISVGVNPEKLVYFIRFYFIIYATVFYLYFSFKKYGFSYAEKFYKQLLIVLNIFSVLNLYEIIFNRPLLERFMIFTTNSYNYNIGTEAYRTVSFFNHPIIAGLFFTVLIFMNHYMIKNLSIYLFQGLALLNLYSTMSRSSWIAFVVGLVFFYLLRVENVKRFKLPKRFTRKKLLFAYFSIVPIAAVILFISVKWTEILSVIVERFGNSLSLNSTDGSNLQRTMTIELIFNKMTHGNILNSIFGYGFNTVREFMIANPLLIRGFGSTDNSYISWIYEYGIVGIFIYLGIGMSILKSIKINKLHWVTELSLVLAVVISVSIFFFEYIGWVGVSVLFSFVLCCLIFLPGTKKQKKNSESNELLKETI